MVPDLQDKKFFFIRLRIIIGLPLLLATLLFGTLSLSAQTGVGNDAVAMHIGIGSVVAVPVVTDNNFSSIPYSAANVGATVFLTRSRPSVYQEFKALFFKGKLNSGIYNNVSHNQYFTADYTRLHSLGNQQAAVAVKLGPQLSVLYQKREYDGFVNRKKAFEFAASIAFSGMASHTFEGGVFEGVTVSNRIDVPVVSMVQYPSYGSEQTEGDLGSGNSSVGNPFKGGKLSTVGNFLRVRNNVSVTKEWNQRHGIGVVYTWDYYQLTKRPPVKQAAHILSISYTIKL